MTQSVLDKTQLLNVDLDIRSKSDLQPLVDAIGKRMIVLYVGRENRHYKARLELVGSHLPQLRHPKSPETLILEFCKVICRLPPDARKLWDGAKTRELDIGIESGKPYKYYWFALAPKAIKAALEMNAQIAVTVYGPMKKAKKSSKPRRAASSA